MREAGPTYPGENLERAEETARFGEDDTAQNEYQAFALGSHTQRAQANDFDRTRNLKNGFSPTTPIGCRSRRWHCSNISGCGGGTGSVADSDRRYPFHDTSMELAEFRRTDQVGHLVFQFR